MISLLSLISLALTSMVVASIDVDCSDSNESTFLSNSYSESSNLANIAHNYMQQHGTSDPIYVAYFGAHSGDNGMQSNIFDDLIIATSLTLSCSNPNSLCPQSDIDGYADPDVSPSFCPCFYNQVATSDICSGMTVDAGNIRGGTMLSIVSTVVSITDQKVSGCKNARDLAISDFNAAATNADSYSCYAMQVYINTQC